MSNGEYISLSVLYVGFNLETIEHKNVNFSTWDVSGRCGIVRNEINKLYPL